LWLRGVCVFRREPRALRHTFVVPCAACCFCEHMARLDSTGASGGDRCACRSARAGSSGAKRGVSSHLRRPGVPRAVQRSIWMNNTARASGAPGRAGALGEHPRGTRRSRRRRRSRWGAARAGAAVRDGEPPAGAAASAGRSPSVILRDHTRMRRARRRTGPHPGQPGPPCSTTAGLPACRVAGRLAEETVASPTSSRPTSHRPSWPRIRATRRPKPPSTCSANGSLAALPTGSSSVSTDSEGIGGSPLVVLA
jgi:hypothetical protein